MDKEFKHIDRIEVPLSWHESIVEWFLDWWHRPSRKDLEADVVRLTNKCAERGDENAALQAQLAALQGQVEQAQRDYRLVRRESPERIMAGKDPEANHLERLEYENNRLRVFINTVHRNATEIINGVASLNKDLQRSKNAMLGALVPEPSKSN